jgi:prolyl-tRNA editing enzyme YbaK/EbsC (Cys-tRNA(Pro) deacylase)
MVEETQMAIERARKHLEKWSLADRLREFDASSATVELAAMAVGCEPARIAKTLSFAGNGRTILVVLAGDAKVDSAKFKAQFGIKARLLDPADVERLVGYEVGGVCPFGVNEGVAVYLDISLRRFDTVFPAGGSNRSPLSSPFRS